MIFYETAKQDGREGFSGEFKDHYPFFVKILIVGTDLNVIYYTSECF